MTTLDVKKAHTRRKAIIRSFLLTFAPIAVILLGLGFWTTQELTDTQLNKVWADQGIVLSNRKMALLESFDNGLEKLQGIAGDRSLMQILDANTPDSKARLEESFVSLLFRNHVFDSISWIDQTGLEKVWVEWRGDKVVPIAVGDLRDQSQRDYFRRAMQLSAGTIFISPLTLNDEHAGGNEPFKPTLYFATPVRDSKAHTRGIFIINMNAGKMLDKIPLQHFTGSQLMWLDEKGYWLRPPDSQDDFGLPMGRADTFAGRYPEVWQAMERPNQFRFSNVDGLWAWTDLNPKEVETGVTVEQDRRWRLVSLLPARTLFALRIETVKRVAPIILVSLLISALLIYLQARRGEQRMALELERGALLVRLQRIASRIPGVIYEYQLYPDGSSCFPYASEAIWSVFRVSPDEVCEDASKVFAILHPEDLERIKMSIRNSAVTLTPWIEEFRVCYGDGASSWLSGNALPQKQPDGSVLWHGFIHDISDRKEVEKALRELNSTLEQKVQVRTAELQESESRFRQITESLPQLVWTCRPDGSCDYLSRQWVDFTGIPSAEQLGFNWLNQVHPTDKRNLLRHWKKAVVAGQPFMMEYRIRRSDGVYHWFDGRAIPLRDQKGDIRKWFGSSTDITERKQVEQELREHQSHYERLLKLEVASQTVAAIAHEMNQPLNAAASYTDAALRFLKTAPPNLEQTQHALSLCAQQIQRGGQVIHELCRYLRSGKVTTDIFDLNELVERVLHNLEIDGQLENYNVVLDLMDQSLLVRADPLQIEKALNNLIRNGIEAMQEAKLSAGSIYVAVNRGAVSGHFAQITVRDSGPGLSDMAVKKLFHPFYTTKPKGLGIGLAISRAMLQAQGGDLWADPLAKPGATFHMVVPFATEAAT